MGITDQTGNKTRRSVSEAARAARAAYYRQWRNKNPGKNTEYCNRYWEKKAAQEAAKNELQTAKSRKKPQSVEVMEA